MSLLPREKEFKSKGKAIPVQAVEAFKVAKG
jgi:hypothetical protein